MYELVNTSVPNGLIPGSHGFSTVAMTKGMPDSLRSRVEGFCGYPHRTSAHDGSYWSENPVNWFHLKLPSGDHIVGRTAPSAFDYTGRTNRLSHVFVVPQKEMPVDGGSAVLQLLHRDMTAEWTGEPRYLTVDRRTADSLRGMPLQHGARPERWIAFLRNTKSAEESVCLAKRFAQFAANSVRQGKIVWFKASNASDSDGERLLGLFADLINLMPVDVARDVTFSTFSPCVPGGVTCHLRGIFDSERAFESVKSLQPWVDLERGCIEHSGLLPEERPELLPAASPRNGVGGNKQMPRSVSVGGGDAPRRMARGPDSWFGKNWWYLPVAAVVLVAAAIVLMYRVSSPRTSPSPASGTVQAPAGDSKTTKDPVVVMLEKAIDSDNLIKAKTAWDQIGADGIQVPPELKSRARAFFQKKYAKELIEKLPAVTEISQMSDEEIHNRIRMIDDAFEKNKEWLSEGMDADVAVKMAKDRKLRMQKELERRKLSREERERREKVEKKGPSKPEPTIQGKDDAASETRDRVMPLRTFSLKDITITDVIDVEWTTKVTAIIDKFSLTNVNSVIYLYWDELSKKVMQGATQLTSETKRDARTKVERVDFSCKKDIYELTKQSSWVVVHFPRLHRTYWHWNRCPKRQCLFAEKANADLVKLIFGSNDAYDSYKEFAPNVAFCLKWKDGSKVYEMETDKGELSMAYIRKQLNRTDREAEREERVSAKERQAGMANATNMLKRFDADLERVQNFFNEFRDTAKKPKNLKGDVKKKWSKDKDEKRQRIRREAARLFEDWGLTTLRGAKTKGGFEKLADIQDNNEDEIIRQMKSKKKEYERICESCRGAVAGKRKTDQTGEKKGELDTVEFEIDVIDRPSKPSELGVIRSSNENRGGRE